jgi:ADP-ribose pyrophosphatase YjhB (NUDIX family)
MRLLNSTIHTSLCNLCGPQLERIATRGIVIKGDELLMLYTERYQDYSLPGGGVDAEEEITQGLIRELKEETGAKGIRDIRPFGLYEEYRPYHKDGYTLLHMLSYCYVCQIDAEQDAPQLEEYEHNNGMRPVWVNIYEAIRHNEATMAGHPQAGMSIERETFLLKRIAAELIEPAKLDKVV